MANSFEESLAKAQSQINNTNILSEDMVSDQWQEGDTCGENGCEKCVKKVDFPRNSQLNTLPHEDAPTTEFVCIHHGIVAAR